MKKKLFLMLFELVTFFMFEMGVKAETVYEVSSVEDYFDKIETIHNSSNEEFTISLGADIVIDSETVEKNSNMIDNGNTVTILGNGHTYSITVGDKGRLLVSNATLNLGAADGNDTLIIQGAGDGVAASASLVTVENGTTNMYNGVTLKDNKSGSYGLNGGAIRLKSNGIFNMYGGVITNNSVETSGSGGGAVMVDSVGAIFNMYDGEISNNISNSWGGGICLLSGSVNIEGGIFKDNQGTYGGAIASIDGIITISNATFEGNYSYYGGALLSFDSEGGTGFVISNSEFKNNEAVTSGGAICAWGTSVVANNSKIYGNEANSGGGIKVYSGEADFSTSSVYNNKAGTKGNDFSIDNGTDVSLGSPLEMQGYAEFDSKKFSLVNWYSDEEGERYSSSNPTSIIDEFTVSEGGAFNLTVSGNEAALVTFDTDGGTEIEEQFLELGNKATEPAEPTKFGYIFDGWYTSTSYDTEFDFDTSITGDVTIYAKWNEIIYYFIEGDGQEIEKGEEATFTVDASYSLFGIVYVDELLVDPSNYTSSEGSTIVTLNQSYLSTLSVGTHTLKIVFLDGGTAITTFTIKEKSQVDPTPDPDDKEDETTPDETKPDETTPDETKPDDTKPDDSKSDETPSDSQEEIINPSTGDDINKYVFYLIFGVVGLSISVINRKISAKH